MKQLLDILITMPLQFSNAGITTLHKVLYPGKEKT